MPIEPFKLGEPGGREGEGKSRARVTKSEFKVAKTGSSETINAFPCEEYLVTWLVEIEDLETKTKTENTMMTNLWTTPETAAIRKLQAEQEAFSRAYMTKLGVNLTPAAGQGPAGALVDLFSGLKGAISQKLSGGEAKKTAEDSFFLNTVEVKSIHTESIAADAFEVPSGYAKER